MTIIDCDLLVIGGGINGAGIARDAAGRGARVVVLEAGDIAGGTSSASTKLIHGGLRYLEHYEFGLVRESLAERERLWAIAPHIIWPMRFVLPHVKGLRPRWLLRLGLFLYDHIGGRKRLPATQSLTLAKHETGAPLKPDYRHGFIYSDCWVDDARLVVLNLRDAANNGALIFSRNAAKKTERGGDVWIVEAKDGQIFHARALVNAAGPAVLDVLALTHERDEARKMRLVRGSHIVVRRLFQHEYAYFFQLPDGRIFFAIPYEGDFTLIGTTDADHHGGLRDVRADDEEIAYLCEGASTYFRQPITPADVVWSFAGVRPLLDDGSAKPEAATRGYTLEITPETDGAPLLSVFGGKLTTYRHLAASAIVKLAEHLPILSGPDWTASKPLPGGDFPCDGINTLVARIQSSYPFLEPHWAQRLARCYGTLVFTILGEAKALSDCGRHFGHGLTETEVRYLIAQEWARHGDDVLWRRTKMGLHLSPEECAAVNDFVRQLVEARP